MSDLIELSKCNYDMWLNYIFNTRKTKGIYTAIKLIIDERASELNKTDKGIFAFDLSNSWYVLGSFFRKNDFKRALYAFKKSWHANHRDAAAVFAIGNCYSELKKYMLSE